MHHRAPSYRREYTQSYVRATMNKPAHQNQRVHPSNAAAIRKKMGHTMYVHWAYTHRSMPHMMKAMREAIHVAIDSHPQNIRSTA